jgi:hypothetical protein
VSDEVGGSTHRVGKVKVLDKLVEDPLSNGPDFIIHCQVVPLLRVLPIYAKIRDR